MHQSFKINQTKNSLCFNLRRRLTNNQSLNVDSLKNIFKKFNKPNHYDHILAKNTNLSKLKRCSVLVPISFKNESNDHRPTTYFTLTKRPDTMKTFKGQVCFVGGKRDDSDQNDVATALREAKEEINIESNRLQILAQLCSPLIILLASPRDCRQERLPQKFRLDRHQTCQPIFHLSNRQFIHRISL